VQKARRPEKERSEIIIIPTFDGFPETRGKPHNIVEKPRIM
jgi:hypothetical protein